MNRTKILFSIAALLALAGCGKELAPMGAEMTVEASVCALTKVSAAGDAFTTGDQIAVFAWLGSATQNPSTRVVDGVVNTFDGTSWTPASQMRWQVTDDPHYFLGVSPAPKGAIADLTAVPYTLDPAKYAESDLLLATTPDGVKNTGAAVQLAFRHAMAKLSVNLKFRKQWATKPTVRAVTVSAQSTANVNYLTQTVTATGAASAVTVPETVSVASGYDRSFSGLQVPQTGVRKITVTIDGKDFVYEAGEDITLAAGRNTTLNLAVGRDKIELEGISLAPWTAEDPLSEGEAVSANRYLGHGYVDMGEVTIGGAKVHLYWATCNVGAENPWDYGDYYAWGEKATKDSYTWGNYAFMQEGQNDSKHITKYTIADGQIDCIWYDGSNFIGDGRTSFADLYYADDAAHQLWGGNWHIPAHEEWTALLNTTLYDWSWTTDYLGDGSNHAGRIVTRKNVSGTDPCAGNSIFLPAAGSRGESSLDDAGTKGFYWTSSVSNYSRFSLDVRFEFDKVLDFTGDRYSGQSLRPVFFKRYPVAAVDVAPMDIGKVLAADGKIYADAAQATAAGTTAQAVIAYVGSVPNYFDKFLAIAMEDAYGYIITWADALTKVGEYAAAHPITLGGTTYNSNALGNTIYDKVARSQTTSSATRTTGVVKGWRMPSVTDWRYIFEGFGGPAVASQPGIENKEVYCNGEDVKNTINAACGNTALGGCYWSSSEGAQYSVEVCVYHTFYSYFWWILKSNKMNVRAVFAY